MNKTAETVINRGFFGVLYLAIVGLIGMIAFSVAGVTLSGSLTTLGTAIGKGNIMGIFVWAMSILIFAGVGIGLYTRHSGIKLVGRHETDKDVHLDKHTSILAVAVLGILISISLYILQWFYVSIGWTTDTSAMILAFQKGNIWGILGTSITVIVIGTIVHFLTSKLPKVSDEIKKNVPIGKH